MWRSNKIDQTRLNKTICTDLMSIQSLEFQWKLEIAIFYLNICFHCCLLLSFSNIMKLSWIWNLYALFCVVVQLPMGKENFNYQKRLLRAIISNFKFPIEIRFGIKILKTHLMSLPVQCNIIIIDSFYMYEIWICTQIDI